MDAEQAVGEKRRIYTLLRHDGVFYIPDSVDNCFFIKICARLFRVQICDRKFQLFFSMNNKNNDTNNNTTTTISTDAVIDQGCIFIRSTYAVDGCEHHTVWSSSCLLISLRETEQTHPLRIKCAPTDQTTQPTTFDPEQAFPFTTQERCHRPVPGPTWSTNSRKSRLPCSARSAAVPAHICAGGGTA